MPEAPKRLEAESSIYSCGKIGEMVERTVNEVMGAAAVLELRPFAIDGIPFFSEAQTEAIIVWLDEHRFVNPDGPSPEDCFNSIKTNGPEVKS